MRPGWLPIGHSHPTKVCGWQCDVQKLPGVVEQIGACHVLASARGVQPLKRLLPAPIVIHDAGKLELLTIDRESGTSHQGVQQQVLFYKVTSGCVTRPSHS